VPTGFPSFPEPVNARIRFSGRLYPVWIYTPIIGLGEVLFVYTLCLYTLSVCTNIISHVISAINPISLEHYKKIDFQRAADKIATKISKYPY